MSRILIVGCGDIGLGLAKVLLGEGHQVSALKRSPLAQAVPGLTVLLADIAVASDLAMLPTDFDQVTIILSPDSRDEQSYRRVYLQGMENLFEYFAKSKTRPHWLFVSSTSVYGQNAGQWVDEDSVTAPESATAKIILQTEQRVLSENSKNTIVRFSGIYGPAREALISRVKAGTPIQFDPPYYTNRIHRDDCIGVLARLLKQHLAGSSLGNIYLATDSDPAPIKEVACWIADKLNCGAPPAKQSAAPTQNKRCSNRKLRELGYQFRFNSYRDGYSVILKITE